MILSSSDIAGNLSRTERSTAQKESRHASLADVMGGVEPKIIVYEED